MIKVCFLLNNEFILDNRVKREAETLVKAGYEVHLLAVKSRDKQNSLPIQENQNGVHIHRIFRKHLKNFSPFNANHIKSFVKIITSYRRFDVVHAHDANTLLLGLALARFWRARLIYDSHELWESVFDENCNKLKEMLELEKQSRSRKRLQKQIKQTHAMKSLETLLIKKCDAVITVNDSLKEMLKQKSNDIPREFVSIRNIPEYFAIKDTDFRMFHNYFDLPPETKIILYQGQISDNRGIIKLLDMMEQVTRPDLVLVLMGVLPKKEFGFTLMQYIMQSRKLRQSVFYKDAVIGDKFLKWTASADLGISPILNSRVSYYYSLPNKMFEYIQAEIPVAASSFPEMKNLIDSHHIGFSFDPENTREMCKKIEDYFNNLQTYKNIYLNNIKNVKQELCWENEEKKLIGLYSGLLNHPVNEETTSTAYSDLDCLVN